MGVAALVKPGPLISRQTPGLAGHSGVAVGGKPGTLFVAHQDVTDGAAFEPAIKLQGVNAGNAEHDFDTVGLKHADDITTDGRGILRGQLSLLPCRLCQAG